MFLNAAPKTQEELQKIRRSQALALGKYVENYQKKQQLQNKHQTERLDLQREENNSRKEIDEDYNAKFSVLSQDIQEKLKFQEDLHQLQVEQQAQRNYIHDKQETEQNALLAAAMRERTKIKTAAEINILADQESSGRKKLYEEYNSETKMLYDKAVQQVKLQKGLEDLISQQESGRNVISNEQEAAQKDLLASVAANLEDQQKVVKIQDLQKQEAKQRVDIDQVYYIETESLFRDMEKTLKSQQAKQNENDLQAISNQETAGRIAVEEEQKASLADIAVQLENLEKLKQQQKTSKQQAEQPLSTQETSNVSSEFEPRIKLNSLQGVFQRTEEPNAVTTKTLPSPNTGSTKVQPSNTAKIIKQIAEKQARIQLYREKLSKLNNLQKPNCNGTEISQLQQKIDNLTKEVMVDFSNIGGNQNPNISKTQDKKTFRLSVFPKQPF